MITLNENDIIRLIDKYWIYLLINGRRKRTRTDLRGDNNLIRRMRRLAKLCDMYNGHIAKEFGVKIDIIDCWKDCIDTYQVNILYIKEDEVLRHFVLFAKYQKEKLNNLIKSVNLLEEVNQEQELYKLIENNSFNEVTYDSIFTTEAKRAIVDKAMLDLNIINDKGVCMLIDRHKGQLAGFIDASKKNNMIISHSLILLGEVFCKKLGMSNTRLKKDSIQYTIMAKDADTYFKELKKKQDKITMP